MSLKSGEERDNYRKVKIVLLGDKAVGKSSIINRYISGGFEERMNTTVGVDFMSKRVQFQNTNFRLEIWDTAGQEKFRSLVRGYLKGADACLFVYDRKNPASYKTLVEWINIFEQLSYYNTYRLVIANKVDLGDVTFLKQKEEIKMSNCDLSMINQVEVSAKTGLNIDHIFQLVLKNAIEFRTMANLGTFRTRKDIMKKERKLFSLKCCSP